MGSAIGSLHRFWQYAVALQGVGKLDRDTALLSQQSHELISRCFSYGNGFIKPVQLTEELALLLDDVRKLNPARVMEIGTSMGGTLFLWTRLAQADATLVSVDLRGGKFGGGYSFLRIPLYRRFARRDQKLHLLRADSHAKDTLLEVNRLFKNEPIDFLFIDGDHTYEGVKEDWQMYSPLVRQGGLIAFHDVAGNYQETEVKKFWDSIKSAFTYREYIADSDGRYGIGVIFK